METNQPPYREHSSTASDQLRLVSEEVLPAREGPHRGEEEDGEEGGQHGD